MNPGSPAFKDSNLGTRCYLLKQNGTHDTRIREKERSSFCSESNLSFGLMGTAIFGPSVFLYRDQIIDL